MRYITAVLAAFGLLLLGTMSAHADHNTPTLTVGEVGDCGQVAFSTAWTADTHTVANTVLVVQAGGVQQTAAIGETLEVGSTEDETATIRYRVWGGGERAGDVPALDDLDALLVYLGDNPGGELDADPPGVAWLTLEVEGCPVEPDPEPTEEPTEEPTDEPVDEPVDEDPVVEDEDTDPVAVPTSVPAGKELPKTGVSPVLAGLVGVGLLGAGGGLLAWQRRRVTS